jgi:hypothetical protein
MPETPQLRSKEQIFGQIVDAILARVTTINDLSKNSVLSQIIDAFSQVGFKSSADLIQMIDSSLIDRAVGETLQRMAKDRNVPIISGSFSNTKVSITDKSFEKIETVIYAGQPAPIAGSSIIYVANASKFAATGQIYLGRGTANAEGPLNYTSITQEGGGAYYAIHLDGTTLTTKFHNIGEKIVMAQGGNRNINSGLTVQTPQGGNLTSILFSTTSPAVILDGEVTVTNVPVLCQQLGPIGNVPAGAITEATGLSFVAAVRNDQPISNGLPPDNDDTLRQRIKDYEQAKSKGTENAIRVSALDVISPDELKKVLSANVIRHADNSATLVFDDGAGYEPLFAGIGIEVVVDSALGGEKEVQLRKFPVAQARVKNNQTGPFAILDNWAIDVRIQNTVATHYFINSDFQTPGSASTTEIVNSINGDSNFNAYATTADGGTKIVLYPRDKGVNTIQVMPRNSVDANDVLGFPILEESTARFYKNDRPLTQDGISASVNTRAQSSWSNAIAGPTETLILSIDNTPNITISFSDLQFQAIDQSYTMSASTSIDVWAQVFNNSIPGITAEVNGELITFTSNKGANNNAAINISGGSLKDKVFAVGSNIIAVGQSSDYALNKQTGQVQLTESLIVGDRLTVGSEYTRAKFLSTSLPLGPSQSGNLWMISDGNSDIIANGIKNSTLVTFQNLGLDHFKITTTTVGLVPEGFELAQTGDWLLIWPDTNDSGNYPLLYNHIGLWRIESAITGEIKINVGSNLSLMNGTITAIPNNRIVIVRSDAPIQKLSFSPQTLSSFVNQINTDLVGVKADILSSSVRLSTKSANLDGELVIIAADTGGRSLGFPVNTINDSVTSHTGFSVTSDSESGVPDFITDQIATVINDTTITANVSKKFGQLIEVLDHWDTTSLAYQPDSNRLRKILIKDYDSALNQLSLRTPKFLKTPVSPLLPLTRFFTRSAFRFDSTDTVTAIIDGDFVTKSYSLPVARRIKVSSHSSPSLQDFSADDVESSLDLGDQSSFYDFDFSDFKVWRQAQNLLTDGTYILKAKSADFGPSFTRVGFVYPDNLTQTELSVNTSAKETNVIEIVLPIQTQRNASWAGDSAFTVSVTTTGGKDVAIFTHRAGTLPSFILSSGIQVGDICIINDAGNFLSNNEGLQAKVTNITATSFTISMPTGKLASDNISFSNITNVNGVTTVITNSPHLAQTNDRIGFWNTATSTGLLFPFNSVGYISVVNPTTFTIPTPVGVPGGAIVAGTHVNNLVTITSAAHGLTTGNIVVISGVSQPNYNGTHPITVINSNQFQYVVNGSSANIASGRFDFQSYAPIATTIVNIATLNRVGYLVTVAAAGHTFTAGDIVQIVGASDINFDGNYVIDSVVPGVSFTYYQSTTGALAGTLGTATLIGAQGSMARAIGSSANYLAFAEVSATAQEVTDFVTTSASNYLNIENLGPTNAIINVSTEDLDLVSNYLTANITAIDTLKGSRQIKVTCDANISVGANIAVDTTLNVYDGDYIVLESVQSGLNYILTLQSSVLATVSGSNVVTGTLIGTLSHLMLLDGDNDIKLSDLQSVVTLPQFVTKRPWVNVPAIDEEVRLIATTVDQLSRFWNQLVVTGLSNVAQVQVSEYGRQLQIMTNTFGSSGSVEIAGGRGNSLEIALLGSGSDFNNVGTINIPYDARNGLKAGNWIEINQTVRENKHLNFSNSTAVQVFTNGMLITAGTGSFQNKRTITADNTSVIRIENHGKYQAIIGINGTALGLGQVKEGDWVRLKNVSSGNTWSVVTSYVIGNKVDYNGYTYKALANNTAITPDSDSATWLRMGMNTANQGIFKVVRVYGTESFWLENANSLPEISYLNDANEISFYSYDSVMPGDTLVISGINLGLQNVGRYKVVDESYGVGYIFPTATRIYTTPIITAAAPTILGDSYVQVNVEEESPQKLLKKMLSVGIGQEGLATIILDSPELVDRLSSSASASLTVLNKLDMPTDINFGVDGYRNYNGLIAQLNKVIYGDPSNPEDYQGVRAAGTDIDIKEAIIKPIFISLAIRVKTNFPFSEVRERVKSAAASYVNTLGVGEQVSLSKVVEAVSKINGIASVVIISPTYTSSSDRISVGNDQRASIINPTNDVTVSALT